MRRAAELLAIVLAPTVAVGALFWLPPAWRALRRTLQARAAGPELVPHGPPLEQISADLRRLPAEHEAVRRSTGLALRARRLTALQGALTDCALDAARAVGLPPPEVHGREPLSREQLHRVLTQLRDAGLVLPEPDLGP